MIRTLIVVVAIFLNINIYAESVQNIMYINGIQNLKSDAIASAKRIKILLEESENHSIKRKFKIHYIWNPIGFEGTSGSLSLPQHDTDLQEDLDELFQSKVLEERYKEKYSYINAPHDAISPVLDRASASTIFNFKTEELPSFELPINNGRNYIENKNLDKLIIVAHSQGNLIANYLWAWTVKENGDGAFSKLRIVNVANTTLFSPNQLNFTHDSDAALFYGRGGLACKDDSLEKLAKTKDRNRSTPECQNDICDFKVSPSTFHGTIQPLVTDVVDTCLNHSITGTYLSNRKVDLKINQNVTFGTGTRFRDRLEDFIYEATESLDRVNANFEISDVSISADFSPFITLGEVPKLTGKIISEHPITSLTINYKLPETGSLFDNTVQTLLDCPEEAFGNCAGFDENNNGEIDLSFVTFHQNRFADIGEYPITIHAENSFGKKTSADFMVTVISKVDSTTVSPNPVDVGSVFKLSVSGSKLTEDVKAYVVGGTECSVSTPTNEVFVEFDCAAHTEGELTYVVYYKEKTTELHKDTIIAGTVSVCTEGQTETQSCSAVANGTSSQSRTCLANGQWAEYSACSITCNTGYHLEGSACVADDTSVAGTESYQTIDNALTVKTITPESGEIYTAYFGVNTEINTNHILAQSNVDFISLEGDLNLIDAGVSGNSRARVAMSLKFKSSSTNEIISFFLSFEERVSGVKAHAFYNSSVTPYGGGEIEIVGLSRQELTKNTSVKYKIEFVEDGTNFAKVWINGESTALPLSFLPTTDMKFLKANFSSYIKFANSEDYVESSIDNVVLKYNENGVVKTFQQNFNNIIDGRLPAADDVFNRIEYIRTQACSIENGDGILTYNTNNSSEVDYVRCEVQRCNPGYHEKNDVCVRSPSGDLVIRDIQLNNNVYQSNEPLIVSFNIANIGDAAIRSVNVHSYIGTEFNKLKNEVDATSTNFGIDVQSSETLTRTIDLSNFEAGEYYFTIIVDEENSAVESNETNNTSEVFFEIKENDIATCDALDTGSVSFNYNGVGNDIVHINNSTNEASTLATINETGIFMTRTDSDSCYYHLMMGQNNSLFSVNLITNEVSEVKIDGVKDGWPFDVYKNNTVIGVAVDDSVYVDTIDTSNIAHFDEKRCGYEQNEVCPVKVFSIKIDTGIVSEVATLTSGLPRQFGMSVNSTNDTATYIGSVFDNSPNGSTDTEYIINLLNGNITSN